MMNTLLACYIKSFSNFSTILKVVLISFFILLTGNQTCFSDIKPLKEKISTLNKTSDEMTKLEEQELKKNFNPGAFKRFSKTRGVIPNTVLYFDAGLQQFNGNTSYEIGGDLKIDTELYRKAHFPVSKLEFPIDIQILTTSCQAIISKKFRFEFNLKASLKKYTGKMEDSDWGIYYLNEDNWENGETWAEKETKDIYSISNADMQVYAADISAEYRTFSIKKFSLWSGFGISYDIYNYDIYDVNQWYPSENYYKDKLGIEDTGDLNTVSHEIINGDVLKYNVSYLSTWFKLKSEFKFSDLFSLRTSFGFSPYTLAKDKDNHLLRSITIVSESGKKTVYSMKSKGECTGMAYLFDIGIKGKINKNWFYRTLIGKKIINTTGIQTTNYISFETTNEMEIKSAQSYFFFSIGRNF